LYGLKKTERKDLILLMVTTTSSFMAFGWNILRQNCKNRDQYSSVVAVGENLAMFVNINDNQVGIWTS
jgi:hypothetical protein